MTDLEISIAVGSVVAASFFIGCILGEVLFRALRHRREAAFYKRQREHERACQECCGDGDIPCGVQAYRCSDCERELGGE